uniref:SSD domain-containing protein n=1 Tax=Panagrolaimus superbus TaxID=310955 RepID=A0A914YA02_9BILA
MGFRFGTILCVTPFLVLAISVDDAYLMINSWQRIRKEKRELDSISATIHGKIPSPSEDDETLQSILAGVFIDTAPSITITTLTNVLAFGVGALTPTPEIQLFSIGNAVAIIVDYIYQWTVYGSFMAIYGRIELSANGKILKKENIEKDEIQIENKSRTKIVKGCNNKALTNPFISSLIMALLAVYFYISLYGILNTKAELQPTKLFLKTSDVLEVR